MAAESSELGLAAAAGKMPSLELAGGLAEGLSENHTRPVYCWVDGRMDGLRPGVSSASAR